MLGMERLLGLALWAAFCVKTSVQVDCLHSFADGLAPKPRLSDCMRLTPIATALRSLAVTSFTNMLPRLMRRSPPSLELCKPWPTPEVGRRSLASLHRTCAARAELVSGLPDPLVSRTAPRRMPHAAAAASVADDQQTASAVSRGVEESTDGGIPFQRLGLDHRITVGPGTHFLSLAPTGGAA